MSVHVPTALLDAWATWMADMSVQVAVLVAVLWGIDRLLLRRAWPGLRAALWLLVALKLVLPPDLASPVSVTAPAAEGLAPIVAVPTAAAATPVVAATGPVVSWALLAFAIWALGVLVLSIRRVRAHRAIAQVAVLATPAGPRIRARVAELAASLGLRRAPDVRVVAGLPSPAVFGVRRPVVLLPESVQGGHALDHVLAHELAHVRRGDLRTQACFAWLRILYWFHPAVALAARRANAAREVCADLHAASLGTDPAAYRSTLLAHAARLVGRPPADPLPLGAGFLLGRSSILVRLEALDRWGDERLAGNGRGAVRHRLLTALCVVAFGLAVLPMAFTPTPSSAPSGGETLQAVEAELAEAEAQLAAAMKGEGPHGCFDRRFAYFRVRNLMDRRATLIDQAAP